MTKQVFKQNNQGEIVLFPSPLDENIPKNHLVRIINEVVDKLDISNLLDSYEGGGTSAYHPRMLLKVLLYGYSLKIYTGRKIANALLTDITFMWLAGRGTPNFRTINLFRSGRLKESISSIFKSLLMFMFEEGYVRLEEYYCDGTILQADANKHKVTWRKNLHRMSEKIEARIDETLKEIDEENDREDALYGDKDLEINGTEDITRKQRIDETIKKLSRITGKDAEQQKKDKELLNRLETDLLRAKIYEEKEAVCEGRSGYSTTDPEASPMPTKECKDDIRPAYNGIIGSEDQYITGLSVHPNPNDGTCFKQHLEEALSLLPHQPGVVVADAIFGTEENYEYMAGKENIDDMLKYPSYDKEQEKSFKENLFHKDNMPYDAKSDSYLCPEGKHLVFKETKEEANKNGFISTFRIYECEGCSGCPFFHQCGSSQREEGSNRQIRINENLECHKQRMREKLKSEKGRRLMKQRGHDVETCFGDIKGNQLFRRVHLRGLAKVKTEFTVIAMSHNLRKMQIRISKVAV
jgi:transposase